MGGSELWDVAIWGTYAPPFGGMANHIMRLMERMDAEGIRARVFNRASDAECPPRAICVRRRQVSWFLRFLLFSPDRMLYVFTGRWQVMFLARVVKALRGKPYILRIGDERIVDVLTGRSRLKKWFARSAFRHADHIVAVSPHLAEVIARAGIEPGGIHVIPGFIPPRGQLPPYEDVAAFAREHSPVLAACGQLAVYQGQDAYGMDVLTRAMQTLRKDYPRLGLVLSLYSAGDTVPGLDGFQRRLEAAGLVGQVLIRARAHEFWPILKSCDAFVRPTRTEGDSNTIREAISLGVPVVASDARPRPAPTILFRSGDGEDLARAVREVLADLPAHKARFAAAEVADNAPAILDLIRKCLGR